MYSNGAAMCPISRSFSYNYGKDLCVFYRILNNRIKSKIIDKWANNMGKYITEL